MNYDIWGQSKNILLPETNRILTGESGGDFALTFKMVSDPNYSYWLHCSMLMRALLLALLVLPQLVLAECVHINWDDYRHIDDGPGTRGSLDGTMSLDCLTLIGVKQGEHRKIAYLRDDTGKIHTVTEGRSIGMQSGVVLGVYDDHLLIEEYRQVDSEWVPYNRTLTLSVENYIRK